MVVYTVLDQKHIKKVVENDAKMAPQMTTKSREIRFKIDAQIEVA